MLRFCWFLGELGALDCQPTKRNGLQLRFVWKFLHFLIFGRSFLSESDVDGVIFHILGVSIIA